MPKKQRNKETKKHTTQKEMYYTLGDFFYSTSIGKNFPIDTFFRSAIALAIAIFIKS